MVHKRTKFPFRTSCESSDDLPFLWEHRPTQFALSLRWFVRYLQDAERMRIRQLSSQTNYCLRIECVPFYRDVVLYLPDPKNRCREALKRLLSQFCRYTKLQLFITASNPLEIYQCLPMNLDIQPIIHMNAWLEDASEWDLSPYSFIRSLRMRPIEDDNSISMYPPPFLRHLSSDGFEFQVDPSLIHFVPRRVQLSHLEVLDIHCSMYLIERLQLTHLPQLRSLRLIWPALYSEIIEAPPGRCWWGLVLKVPPHGMPIPPLERLFLECDNPAMEDDPCLYLRDERADIDGNIKRLLELDSLDEIYLRDLIVEGPVFLSPTSKKFQLSIDIHACVEFIIPKHLSELNIINISGYSTDPKIPLAHVREELGYGPEIERPFGLGTRFRVQHKIEVLRLDGFCPGEIYVIVKQFEMIRLLYVVGSILEMEITPFLSVLPITIHRVIIQRYGGIVEEYIRYGAPEWTLKESSFGPPVHQQLGFPTYF